MLPAQPAKRFTCTVTGSTAISEAFHRVHLRSPDLLDAIGNHPTMWARFWFRKDGRPHQRAFTVLDADAVAGTFSIDVHLHGGTAGTWATTTTPGAAIDAIIRGTGFAAPRAGVTHMHLVGDAASIPAIRTILAAIPDLPATLWLEQQHASEVQIPLPTRSHHDIVRVARGDGNPFVAAVKDGLERRRAESGLESDWFWLACEATANRGLMMHLRGDLNIPRSHVAAMAYWSQGS